MFENIHVKENRKNVKNVIVSTVLEGSVCQQTGFR